ncbi:DUF1877 family protein [Actinoplanes xinjiangensis]|jgi:hypothetical protein|uniref:Uncharacterized protein DUF1877 n=1 Tax=Actinoplanes xinjiangensis TaxID=512350 RepID=A0A316FHH5_9ACTN|nr:DUF1877 family protein [Actinoplanes xinjiangensis]PWK48214.1 uncharacterized protein DUF1877 [Actinoplanes xinjiangensis]GIF39033.1 hypothetical protein Axi01nite_33440 [Actinoplanes xinjiangensis]
MGLDFACLTVRLDNEPMRRIRADPDLWAIVEDQPPFCGPWPGEQLPEITRQLLAVLPEGTRLTHDFFPGRNHEQAGYLLDPAAYRADRTRRQAEQTRAHRAVFGAEVFADHARSGQGVTWRCSTAAQLTDAVRLIDELDVVAARRGFSVAEMAEIGVYKVHRDEDDDESFTRNLRDLRTWADHCRTVAARGLDLMITLY